MKPRKPTVGKKQPKGDYGIGYARAPEATKFGLGNQAARKRGRPPGRESNATILRRIIDFKVKIELPGGRSKKMGLWEASAWKQNVKAAQGDTRAFNAINDLAERFGVILYDPEPLDNELTDAEAQDVETYFEDWAMANLKEAWRVLRGVMRTVQTCQTIPGRDPRKVRRVDFFWCVADDVDTGRATIAAR